MITIDTLQKNQKQKQQQQMQYSWNKKFKVPIFEIGIFGRFGGVDLWNHIKQRKQRDFGTIISKKNSDLMKN